MEKDKRNIGLGILIAGLNVGLFSKIYFSIPKRDQPLQASFFQTLFVPILTSFLINAVVGVLFAREAKVAIFTIIGVCGFLLTAKGCYDCGGNGRLFLTGGRKGCGLEWVWRVLLFWILNMRPPHMYFCIWIRGGCIFVYLYFSLAVPCAQFRIPNNYAIQEKVKTP